MRTNRILRALLLASCALPTTAWAQDGEESADSGPRVDQIIVTAERREQNLQDVPIAISAFSDEELKDRSVTSIADLQLAVPNIHFNPSTQGATNLTIGIRGMKNGSVELSNEQPVATYVDGVYQGTPLGAALLLGPDVASIEVLRGPQGTLFGRNTVGGALTINTKQPVNEFEGRIMAGFGNYDRREAQGMLNAPLGDIAAVRLNFATTRTDGYTTNATTGDPLGDTNLDFFRGQLKFAPADRFEAIVRGHWFRQETGGNVVQGIFLTDTPGNLTLVAGGLELGLSPSDPAVAAAYFCPGNGPEPNFRPKCYSSNNPVGATFEEWSTSATLALKLTDNVQLKSISAYTEYSQTAPLDFDASPFSVLWNNAMPYGNVFTQEAQLNGAFLDDRLQFASGVFYFRHYNNDRARNDVLSVFSGGAASRSALESFHVDQSIGIYGQGTYSLSDSLRVTAGIRYTKEKKEADTTQFRLTMPPMCTLPVPNPECVASTENKYDSVDYTAGLDYDLTDDVMAYARVAKGFLAGGINQRSTTGVPFITYDPQTNRNYELGLKAALFDQRVVANLAVFQMDVTGLQRSVPRSFLNTDGLPVSVVAQINAAEATIRGAELELAAAVTENFSIVSNIGYLDPQYDEFLVDGPDGPRTLDLSGTDFQQTPSWTVGVSPRVTIPLSFGELHGQLDYYWQSEENLAPRTESPLVVPGRDTIQEPYSLINARIALTINENTELAIWGKNLADKRYFTTILDLSTSLGFMNAKVGNPRTYGFQITHSF